MIHRCVFAITKVILLVGRTCQQTDPYGRCIDAVQVITASRRNAEFCRVSTTVGSLKPNLFLGVGIVDVEADDLGDDLRFLFDTSDF